MNHIKYPNFICPRCGNKKHYAKGLCRSCYAKSHRHQLMKTLNYPVNLLLKIGIAETDITDDMEERMDKLMYAKILCRKNAEEILLGIYQDHKTEAFLAEEFGCTRQNISITLLASLEKLRNPVCLDYIYGINPNLEDVVLYFVSGGKKPKQPEPYEPTTSDVVVDETLVEYEEKIAKIQEHITKVKQSLSEHRLIKECDELPIRVRRAMERVGIKTIPDLMMASKIIPYSRLFQKKTYDTIVEWAASIGITIGEEFGIKVDIRK